MRQNWSALRANLLRESSAALVKLVGELFHLNGENRRCLVARYGSAGSQLETYRQLVDNAVRPDPLFYFFSREETRMHVHGSHAEGEAKFWLEPRVELAENYGMTRRRLAAALRLVRENEHAIRKAWRGHFIG